MKKIAAMVFCLSLAVFLIGCAAPPEGYSAIRPDNPYESLLLPEEVKFGMSADEVSKMLNREIGGNEKTLASYYGDPSYDNEYFGGMNRVDLNNYCALSAVTYGFDNPYQQEFEDERTLRRIVFEIRDTIPYDLRTKERHGDIKAECESVKAFLIENFDVPIYEATLFGGKECYKWDIPDQKLGIELRLEEPKTDASHNGRFTLEYFSTDGYRTDWYNI